MCFKQFRISLFVYLCMFASLAVITNAATTVYTSRSLWEQSAGDYEEEFFTDEILNPALTFDTDNGYVDVSGEQGYGTGVWWDRVVPNGATTTWFFAHAIYAFGADWNLAGPGGVGTGIQLYLNGIPVSEEIPNTLDNGFWGIVSTIPFDEILVTAGTTSANAETYVMDNMVYSAPVMVFTKTDNVADGNCVLPNDEFRYTICFDNTSNYTFYGAFVIDFLPDGVAYPAGADHYVYDGNEFQFVEGDPGYNAEEHYYIWELGTMYPGDANCVTLDVVVNNKAMPGTNLHNVAELWADGGDTFLVRATEDTLVCCWGDPNFIYVDQTATGSNTGMSWRDAYVDLADALERAAESDCSDSVAIYVAQGTYDPNQTPGWSFVLPDGCRAYGGFKSGGCDFSERNPKRYKTILTGLIDDDLFPDTDTVVTMGDETLLDGFTVTQTSFPLGRCIYGDGIDFEVAHCTITESGGYGIYAENSNAVVQWCTIRLNNIDGIHHEGEGFTLSVDNSWILRNGECGIRCEKSTPGVKNCIVSESDLTRQGRAGIRLQNPTYPPVLYNLTIANNKEAGIYFADDGNINDDPNLPDYPDVQNCIVYYNNPDGKKQLAGFDADNIANFCCIQDCNEPGTTNINDIPMFAYVVDPNGTPDPNNYHLAYNSVCIDGGNDLDLDYSGQVDIDGEGLNRQYGAAVDIGADEVYDCSDEILTDIDIHNDLDLDADGIVNYVEFTKFSQAWLSIAPADPNFVDPNDFKNWNSSCNLDDDGDSEDIIDLSDLNVFLDNWLWVACWKLEEIEQAMMMSGGGESMMAMESLSMMTIQTATPPEPEASLDTLVQIVGFLDEVIYESPDNIENIHELRAVLMDEIMLIWTRENE